METLVELAKILLPAALLLYGMYILAKAFLDKEFERKLAEQKIDTNKTILPLKLQAYERACLLLERISPQNLVTRASNPSMTVGQLRGQLLQEVRSEFNHNLSQQLYMSDAAWEHVRNAKEEIVALINASGRELKPDARGVELSRNIFNELMTHKEDPTMKALRFVKHEARKHGV